MRSAYYQGMTTSQKDHAMKILPLKFSLIVMVALACACAVTPARADWSDREDRRHDDYYHRSAREHGFHDRDFGGGIVVVAPAPLFFPAPIVMYQQPTHVNMQCASGVTITVTGKGSFTHLLNRANKICATHYPALAPVVVQGAPQGSSYCREYQTTATVGGMAQQSFGTACRQPDGSWQIRN